MRSNYQSDHGDDDNDGTGVAMTSNENVINMYM